MAIGELLTILIILGGTALWIVALIDCAKHEPAGNDKIAWLLIVILGGWIGSLVYWFVRRPKRKTLLGK
jgi:hypothetical protein